MFLRDKDGVDDVDHTVACVDVGLNDIRATNGHLAVVHLDGQFLAIYGLRIGRSNITMPSNLHTDRPGMIAMLELGSVELDCAGVVDGWSGGFSRISFARRAFFVLRSASCSMEFQERRQLFKHPLTDQFMKVESDALKREVREYVSRLLELSC